MENTKYNREQILKFHQTYLVRAFFLLARCLIDIFRLDVSPLFLQKECPDGQFTRRKFAKFLRDQVYSDPRSLILSNLVFNLYDQNDSGKIEFVEFFMMTYMLSQDDPRQRLFFIFKVFDLGKSPNLGPACSSRKASVVASLLKTKTARSTNVSCVS